MGWVGKDLKSGIRDPFENIVPSLSSRDWGQSRETWVRKPIFRLVYFIFLNWWMTEEWWLGRYLERSACDVVEVKARNLTGGSDETQGITQTIKCLCRSTNRKPANTSLDGYQYTSPVRSSGIKLVPLGYKSAINLLCLALTLILKYSTSCGVLHTHSIKIIQSNICPGIFQTRESAKNVRRLYNQ
jgi:hypothetical protein